MSRIPAIDLKTRPWRQPKPKENKPMNKSVRFTIRGIKISQLLDPAVLAAADLVPPDGPAGQPEICLELEGSDLCVRATMNGKSVRKALKVINELGPSNVNVIIGGILKPYTIQGSGPAFAMECAGLTVTPKGQKPAEKPAEVSP